MKKKGFTLVELLVAMSIFVMVLTMAVGAFVTISRFKTMASNMKESQQKIRVAEELIARLSRQAQSVSLTDSKTLLLGFNIKGLDPVNGNTGDPDYKPTYMKFVLTSDGSGQLFFYPEEMCQTFDVSDIKNPYCAVLPSFSAANAVSLLGGTNSGGKIKLDENISKFTEDPTIPPVLNVVLKGNINDTILASDQSSTIKIDTKVVLENIK
jgi:prepilin-type N-terminal cleavage/methylation domain-containing protein